MGSKVGQGRIHGRLLLAEHMRQSRQRVIVIIRRHGHPAGWLVLWSWSFGGFCSWAWVIFCARIVRRAGGWVKARPVSPGRLQKLGNLIGGRRISQLFCIDLEKERSGV